MKSGLLFLSAVTLSIASGAVLAAGEFEAGRSNLITADGYRFVGGEVGYVQESMGRSASLGSGTAAGSLPREQVRQELESFRASPLTSDGYRFIGGEQGYVPSALGR